MELQRFIIIALILLICTVIIPVNANDLGLWEKSAESASSQQWSKNVEGIKIIKMNANEGSWKDYLSHSLSTEGKSDHVLFLVHGVEFSPTLIENYFPENFVVNIAKSRGYDTVVLFEFVPAGEAYLGSPWGSGSAAVKLNEANKIVRTVSGNYPAALCHSNGCVVINKENDFADKTNDGAFWRELIFTGSAAPLTEDNIKKWEDQVTGTVFDSKGNVNPAVFFVMKEGDIVQEIQSDDAFYARGMGYLGDRALTPMCPDCFTRVAVHQSYFNEKPAEYFFDNLPKIYKELSRDDTKNPENRKQILININNNHDDHETDKIYPFFPHCPFCDDDDGNGLGGVDFTQIQMVSISANAAVLQEGNLNKFSYAMKAKKANANDITINTKNKSKLAYDSFFVGLTVPEQMWWVNLNPWESTRIIGKNLENTDAGEVMLKSDLQMKKDYANYENPCNSELGSKFWGKLNEKEEKLVQEIKTKYPDSFKDTNKITFIPVTRHWIVPEKINVYEQGDTVYIEMLQLDIKSDPVYEHSSYSVSDIDLNFFPQTIKDDLNRAAKEYGKYAMDLEDEMIKPSVVRDVNYGQQYADLRMVFSSFVLSHWYKSKATNLIFSSLTDSSNVGIFESQNKWSPESIWKDYKKSFDEFEYKCTKTETYTIGNTIYSLENTFSSGGVKFDELQLNNIGSPPKNLQNVISSSIMDAYAQDGGDYYFGETFIKIDSHGHQNTSVNRMTAENRDEKSFIESVFDNIGNRESPHPENFIKSAVDSVYVIISKNWIILVAGLSIFFIILRIRKIRKIRRERWLKEFERKNRLE